jgi:hypothetical protein
LTKLLNQRRRFPSLSWDYFRLLLRRLAGSAWFSYTTILLLQIKVAWGMWQFRDLTSGDTSSYFINVSRWFESGSTPIAWSPLYISFYASLLHLSHDAFVVTTLHRWITVIALAILVLAVMRRLLPPDLAWFMAGWWVILPINFDALYEVHLFAVIPVLCAALVILGKPGPWRHGVALAMMVGAALLMRNELLLAAGVLAGVMLCAIVWHVKYAPVRSRLNINAVLAYTIPLLFVCLLTAYFYRHASDARDLRAVLDRKHTLNICQTYAFGYQQRHSDFTKSAWTDCQELMTRIYGDPEPSLVNALRRNPSAMLEHFLWNLSLVPNGIEILLFNVSFGKVNPDYAPVTRSWIALPCTLALLAIAAAGSIRLFRNRRQWWDEWLKARAWGWLLLILVGCVTMGVMISQRPRPSYMFSLGILLRAAIGMFLLVILSKPSWRGRMVEAFPIVAVLAIMIVPSYYAAEYKGRPRPLVRGYERLASYEKLFREQGAGLVSPGYGGELCSYVGKGECQPFDYFELKTHVSSANSWPAVLNGSGATLFYADETVLDDPAGQRFVQQSVSSGWITLAFDNVNGQRWMLLGKPGVTKSSSATPGFDLALQSGDVPVVGDWNGNGTTKIGVFRKGIWYLDIDGTHQLASSQAIGWGQEGDLPVVGDWNGDGRTKIGVFRKGVWYLDLDGSHKLTSSRIIEWGQPGDVPVLGDWNKNKKMKIGVFRSGTWFLDTTGAHALTPADQFTVDVK